MATTTWTAGNGSFYSAANWNNGEPVAGVDAGIAGTSIAPLTVTLASGATTANTLTTTFATLVFSGGSLTLSNASSLSGLTESAGLLDIHNGALTAAVTTVSGPVTTTGGTIAIDSGTLAISGVAHLASSFTGAGTLLLQGGVVDSIAGGTVSVAGLQIAGNGTTLDLSKGVLTYVGAFTAGSGTTLTLGSQKTTLNGLGGLHGTVTGAGLILTYGTFDDSGMTLGGSETLISHGAMTQGDVITLGNGHGATQFQNLATHIYDFTFDVFGNNAIGSDGHASFINAGTLEKSAGTGVDRIDATFINAIGTGKGVILVKTGAIYFHNTTDLLGTVTGSSNGGVLLGGGAVDTLDVGVVVSVPTLSIIDSGTVVNVAGTLSIGHVLTQAGGTTLSLAGNTLTLTGQSTLAGLVTGSGTLVNSGTLFDGLMTLGGGETLDNKGVIAQTDVMTLGNGAGSAVLLNDATGTLDATFDLFGNAFLLSDGNARVINAGLFEKTAGTGVDRVDAGFTGFAGATVGRIVAATGALEFSGGSDIKGSVSGAGAVDFGGARVNTLEAGATLSVAAVNIVDSGTTLLATTPLGYAGTLTQSGGTTISLGASTLTLSGPATLAGLVTGSGTVISSGTLLDGLMTLGGNETLDNKGLITQTNVITLGNSTGNTTLLNDATGTLDATFDVFGNGFMFSDGNAKLINAGLLEKTSGAGADRIDAGFIGYAGSTVGRIVATTGALYFAGGADIKGSVSGAGAVNFGGGRINTLEAGTTLSIAAVNVVDSGTTLQLGASISYAGSFTQNASTTIALGSNTLTLTGAEKLSGLVTGTGRLLLNAGASTLVTDGVTIGGAATLEIAGHASQANAITLGDNASSTAMLKIDSGATYNLTDSTQINRNGSTTLNNAGLFEKTGGGVGVATVFGGVVSTGSIAVSIGGLVFASNVVNDGTAAASLGSLLAFSAALTTDSGKAGTVTVAQGGTASFNGFVDAGQTLDFLDATGNAVITSAAAFHGTIAGFVAGDTIDMTNFGSLASEAYSGNTLTITNTSQQSVSLLFAGTHTLANFSFGSDGHGGVLIGDPPAVLHPLMAVPTVVAGWGNYDGAGTQSMLPLPAILLPMPTHAT